MCPYCNKRARGRTYKTNSNLCAHIRSIHGKDDLDKFKTKQCNKCSTFLEEDLTCYNCIYNSSVGDM